MSVKRLAAVIGIAVVIFAILAGPREAGQVVHSGLSGLGAAWTALYSFLGSVFG